MHSSIRLLTRVAALSLTFGIAACGTEDDGTPPFTTPPPGSVLGDAQVQPDAGLSGAKPDGGGAAPEAGAGGGGNPTSDAQVTTDAQSTLDAQPQPTEAGSTSDTGTGTVDATTPVGDGGGGDSGLPRADLGKGNGKDVIIIGDSWMHYPLTGGIQDAITRAAMQSYRKYALLGTKVLTGAIPGQFDDALRADPNIKTVLMTGGGNDIILDSAGADCERGGPNCTKQLDDIAKTLDKLWTKMSASGVMDVVHVMYSEAAVKSNPVKDLPAHNERLRMLCQSHPPMRCYQLNTDALATGLVDGIHPTSAECGKIGKAAFDLMVKEGMRR